MAGLAFTFSPQAEARDLWTSEDGNRYVALNSALKSVLLISDPLYEEGGTSATNFWRLRLDLDAAILPWLTANIAYEQRAVIDSEDAVGANPLLPQSQSLPYRIIPIADAIVDDPSFQYEQGLDRLALSARGAWGQATLGR
ncbi:MAG: hypothetical protein MK135_05610, partial [Polyangiaceae bacterium]|nr:hypothetical protein [Polyangiaceae bacterium]